MQNVNDKVDRLRGTIEAAVYEECGKAVSSPTKYVVSVALYDEALKGFIDTCYRVGSKA